MKLHRSNASRFREEAAAKGLIDPTYQGGGTMFLFDLKHGALWVPADSSTVEKLLDVARSHEDPPYSEVGEMLRLIARRGELDSAEAGGPLDVFWHWPHHSTCPIGDAGISLDEWLDRQVLAEGLVVTKVLTEEQRMRNLRYELWHIGDYELYHAGDREQ